LKNQENATPNPCAEKRGTSLHFVVKPKHRKKKRKTALQNLKKKRRGTFAIFNLGGKIGS